MLTKKKIVIYLISLMQAHSKIGTVIFTVLSVIALIAIVSGKYQHIFTFIVCVLLALTLHSEIDE